MTALFEVLTRIYQVWYNRIKERDRTYKILEGEIEMKDIRKKSNKPRRNTKAWYIEKIMSKFDEYKEIHEQLVELHNQGKIEHWMVMVHGLYNDYSYKWFYGMLHEDNKCKGYGTGKKNTTLWYYRYHLERIEEEIKKARKIIEENR